VSHAAAASTIRDAFSPIMIDGALVLSEVSVGMIEASATRRRSMPCTRGHRPFHSWQIMIRQVLADAFQFVAHLNAQGAQ
jgi:hypothetical protein